MLNKVEDFEGHDIKFIIYDLNPNEMNIIHWYLKF